jgi:hypothetical protein
MDYGVEDLLGDLQGHAYVYTTQPIANLRERS